MLPTGGDPCCLHSCREPSNTAARLRPTKASRRRRSRNWNNLRRVRRRFRRSTANSSPRQTRPHNTEWRISPRGATHDTGVSHVAPGCRHVLPFPKSSAAQNLMLENETAHRLSRYLDAPIGHLRILASGWETTVFEFELESCSARFPELPPQ